MKTKKQISFIVACMLVFILLPFIHAEVVYHKDTAIIAERSHNLDHIQNPDFVEVIDDTCFIKKSIRVSSSGTLRVTSTSCDVVKMYPAVTITVYGIIYFDRVHVTSYDPKTGQPITLSRDDHTRVRPDIVTRSSAQYFSAKHSEFSYLGYYNDTSSHWGVALRFLPDAYIYNSSFHHNYFGFYSFDSDSITIKNSRFYDNLEYGINIHDFSDDFYARANNISGNGNHGFILSKYNDNGKLIDNMVANHTQNAFVKGVVKDYGTHGIILHHESNNALLSRNDLYNNREGLKLTRSHNNRIKTNKIFSDQEEGFYLHESNNNSFKYNRFYKSDDESLYAFNSFGNCFEKSKWYDTDNTVVVKIQNASGTFRYEDAAIPGADDFLNEYMQCPATEATQSSYTTSRRQLAGVRLELSAEESNTQDAASEQVTAAAVVADLDSYDWEPEHTREVRLRTSEQESTAMTREDAQERVRRIRSYEAALSEVLDEMVVDAIEQKETAPEGRGETQEQYKDDALAGEALNPAVNTTTVNTTSNTTTSSIALETARENEENASKTLLETTQMVLENTIVAVVVKLTTGLYKDEVRTVYYETTQR